MNFIKYLRAQGDRALAVGCAVTGALVLLMGYIGTRDAVLVEQQMPYIVSGGLVGIFLLAVGAVLWLSADLRDDWRELRELRRQVTRLADLEERREEVRQEVQAPLPVTRQRRTSTARLGSRT